MPAVVVNVFSDQVHPPRREIDGIRLAAERFRESISYLYDCFFRVHASAPVFSALILLRIIFFIFFIVMQPSPDHVRDKAQRRRKKRGRAFRDQHRPCRR